MAYMTAKYDGTCSKCGGAISAGTEIHWSGRSQACHRACPATTEAPTQQWRRRGRRRWRHQHVGLEAPGFPAPRATVCFECGAKSSSASWPCPMSDCGGDHDWVTDYEAALTPEQRA